MITITSGMGSLADNTSGGSIAYRSSKVSRITHFNPDPKNRIEHVSQSSQQLWLDLHLLRSAAVAATRSRDPQTKCIRPNKTGFMPFLGKPIELALEQHFAVIEGS